MNHDSETSSLALYPYSCHVVVIVMLLFLLLVLIISYNILLLFILTMEIHPSITFPKLESVIQTLILELYFSVVEIKHLFLK